MTSSTDDGLGCVSGSYDSHTRMGPELHGTAPAIAVSLEIALGAQRRKRKVSRRLTVPALRGVFVRRTSRRVCRGIAFWTVAAIEERRSRAVLPGCAAALFRRSGMVHRRKGRDLGSFFSFL